MRNDFVSAQQVELKTNPVGLPQASDFILKSISLQEPASDEVIVKNRHFLVSPSLRQMISKGADLIPGVPFPALAPGDALLAEAIGEVLHAPENSGFAAGDTVTHMYGWRDVAVVPSDHCRKLPYRGDEHDIAYLGHGWTAYAALTRGLTIRASDTVFISSAAGAIGSMAGQIARALGAKRVIGSTSTPAKAAWLLDIGYDAAILRQGDKTVEQQLRHAAPDGIDVFLDLVGGPQLAAAVNAARTGARFLLLGSLSGQLATSGTGRTAPVTLDSTQIILKRMSLRGYSADDDPDAREEWFAKLASWRDEGLITIPHTLVTGLDKAPKTLEAAALGHHVGSVIVRI